MRLFVQPLTLQQRDLVLGAVSHDQLLKEKNKQ